MGTVWVLAIAALAPARARAEDWKPPTAPETALLVSAEVLMAADIALTIEQLHSREAQLYGLYENNPLLGEHPSNARVLAMGGAAMVGLGVSWYFLPSPWRNCLPMAAVFVEIPILGMAALHFRF